MTDEIDAVWDVAFDKYLELAVAKLSRTFPSHLSKEDARLEHDSFLYRLKIHFLFPDLTDLEREQLFVMALNRLALQGYVSILDVQKDRLPKAAVAHLEREARIIEDQFMGSIEVFKILRLPEKLTPFQMRIIERKLFHIVFPQRPPPR